MASTTTDDGFHEIQLNGKQLVFLFMAVTVVSVVIFLCGVLVGRGVRIDDGASAVLEAQAATPAPPVPPAVSAVGSGTPATAGEDLSYPKRLSGGEQPREQLKPARVHASARAGGTGASRAAPAPAVPPANAKPAPAPVAAAPGEPAGSGFAIQLAALRQREEADIIARRLLGKGYPAYVLSPESGAPAGFPRPRRQVQGAR